ncbi:recombination regulator RecX [Xenophilus arseniciresistens]|uniref:Regulatory protein RecX n=1 Tax=Xenophilus arseniciresistens TaxID=1283306 RepID=A0AAE3NA72_9BURK|nr:recombination regulator RecX [Xenophilus arseniciresistens]MDA7418570.1 recombination regulator RecX [Xenophilus arseniciresistens]
MAFAAPSLKGRALRLLSQREHSRAELERKLAAHEEEPGTLAQALDELQARGFISEARVVQSVLHQRAARLGSARIRQELQAKGIDAEAVAQAVQSLQGTELERARALWQRRFAEPPTEPRERARQMRFLMTRGFSAEVVARVLREGAQAPDCAD